MKAIATIRCCALNALGRSEELLRIVRSSHFDETPRIWFWRSLAHMKLGHDRIAREQLRALAPESESGD